jgi:uncharacterized protein YcfL
MKTISQKMLSLAAGASLLVALGCKSHEGPYLPDTSNPDVVSEKNALVVLLDSGVQRSISTEGEIQSATLPDGRLRVMAPIRNRENRRIQVQVNCVFKDEQGFSTGDETAWRTLFLDENATESVEFVSLNARAKNFTIRVRQAR